MEKPTISHFDKYYDIFYHQYERYLPTSFDESPSILEKINKVILHLNQLGKLTNDVVDQWNKIMEWVINEGLTEAVQEKLIDWLNDGTLGELINETLFNSKMNKDDVFYINVKQSPYNLKGDGSDETLEIQKMFDLAKTLGRVTLYFPKGTYVTNKHIRVYKNTRVFGDGDLTVFKHVGTDNQMFLNGEFGNLSFALGYNGEGNLHFHDFVVDLNYSGSSVPDDMNINGFSMAHAKNLIFERLTIKNGQNGHYFQLSSVKEVLIRDCTFKDQIKRGSSVNCEVIQVEYAGASSFPSFGSYDMTATQNVRIENCLFSNVIRGIGNHSNGQYVEGSSTVYRVRDINITDCRFTGILDRALPITCFEESDISGNLIDGAEYGIHVRYSNKNVIDRNVFKNIRLSGIQVEESHDNDFYGNRLINTCTSSPGTASAIRVYDSHNNTFDSDIVKGTEHRYAFLMTGDSLGNRIPSKRYQAGTNGEVSADDSTKLKNLTIGGAGDVLFEGDLNAVNMTADLPRDIRSYSFIIVEGNDSDVSNSVLTSTIIHKYSMVAGENISRFRLITDDTNGGDGVVNKVNFSFATYTTVRIDSIEGGSRIRKIIGVI